MDPKLHLKLRQRQAKARLAAASADESGYVPIPPPVEPPKERSTAKDIRRAYLQGGMLNYSDEALARAKAGLGMGDYEDILALERQRLRDIPAATRIPAEIAGGAITTMATAGLGAGTGVGKAVSSLPAIPRLMGLGAMEGAIAGSGAAEGDLGQRAMGAGGGATLGAATGLAIPAVTGALRGAGRMGAQALGIGESGQARKALTRIAGNMARDEQTAEQLVKRAGRLPQDVPVVAAGRENLQSLARSVAQQPGPAKTMTERAMRRVGGGQLPRLYALTARVTGGRNYGDTLDEIVRRRKRRAVPLYQQAFQRDPVLSDSRLDDLAETDMVKKALAKARTAVSEPTTPGGNPVRLSELPENSIQVWDQVYKQLGSAEHAARSPLKPNTAKARQVGILRNRLREILTDISPSYRQALDTFSEESSLKDAMELGRTVLRTGSEATPEAIKRLPQAEKDMFVVGVGRAIEDQLEGVADVTQMRNAVDKIFNNKRTRDRLAAGLPSLRAYQEFKKGILQEQALLKMRRSVSPSQGSQTMTRALEDVDLQSPTSLHGIIQDMRTLNVFGGMAAARSRGARILESLGNRMRAGPTGGYQEIAGNLMAPASEAPDLMRRVQRQALAEEIYRMMQTGTVGGATVMGSREAPDAAQTLLMP